MYRNSDSAAIEFEAVVDHIHIVGRKIFEQRSCFRKISIDDDFFNVLDISRLVQDRVTCSSPGGITQSVMHPQGAAKLDCRKHHRQKYCGADRELQQRRPRLSIFVLFAFLNHFRLPTQAAWSTYSASI